MKEQREDAVPRNGGSGIGAMGSSSQRSRPAKTAQAGETREATVDPKRHANAFDPLGVPKPEDILPADALTPEVRAAVDTLIREVHHLRASLEKAYKRIAHLENLADRDSLLPVFNRRAFMREFSRMIQFGRRYGMAHSVLYFDLNGMKEVNDTHGHSAGDAMLTLFASILTDNLRQTDIVGRLGGDEFAVILVQTDEATARIKAEELTDRIHGHVLEWKEHSIPLRTACGFYTVRDADTPITAIRTADQAMYRDKLAAKAKVKAARSPRPATA